VTRGVIRTSVLLSWPVRQRRHTGRQLFWRGVVAAFSNTGMAVGIYPVMPHLGRLINHHSELPPNQLRVVAREWAVGMALSAARPIGFLGLPVSVRKPRGPRPIIVVHGYFMNRASFLPLAHRLTCAGLGPITGFEYWTLGKTASAARRLGAYVDKVCAATGADEVDLIGHSMGGMVGRYFVSLRGGGEHVRNLITIGSPHGGTDVSGFGFGRPHRELYPGSSLLDRLESAPVPPKTRITSIWSRSDALVPAVAADMRGVEQIVFDDLGHLSLLASRRVADEIITRLR
jgi:hypothetical protein